MQTAPPEAPPALEPPPESEPGPTPVQRRPETRRLTDPLRREGFFALLGAGLGGVSLTLLLTHWIAPFNGNIGFVLISFGFFVLLYGIVVALEEDAPTVRDRIVGLVVRSIAVLVFGVMAFVIVFPWFNGRTSLFHANFYTQDLRLAGPLAPIGVGGLLHALVGTLEQITITLAITVPLGITCALFMNEIPGRLANLVRAVAAAATALPSIVAGLFIFALAILQFGLPKSGLAAGLALSVMTLPIIIRASDVVLRLVPAGLKEASYALGAGRWRTALLVTLPTARSGLATAVILGAARGIGETSPVLLTAGYSQYLNADPLSGPQTSLPLATFKLVTSGQPNYIARGYGAAALLMSLVLILFLAARAVGGRGPGQLSARQRRARALASARIAGRFAPADHVPDALAPDPSDPGAFDRDAFNPGEYDEPDTTEHDA
ncbi:MAG TPA: ABC transporter permease subunit [Actinocrinis sp.]|jgi:phosphate transport system permease protein|uniref:PstA family ABC transporter permease n=1 Tax=Actinocrinis sp. TaxID=1920516 RepID=UPI002DDCD7E7|nr:ABC transporter permease subunit [Actinocrinis sp.]HEV3173767.1 ABC transporter permease subunit [Actinocrinis sp.]